MLQFCISHSNLSVYRTEKRIHILQRLFQFLGNLTGKAFQRPNDITIVFKHNLRVVVHIPAQFLFSYPRFLISDAGVFYKPSAFQKVAQQFLRRALSLI